MKNIKNKFFIILIYLILQCKSIAFENKFIPGIYYDISEDYTTISNSVIIDYIRNNGPAYQSGMKIGDEIIMVNNKEVKNSLNAFEHVRYSNSKIIKITILRNNQVIELNIKPNESIENGTFQYGHNLKVKTLGYSFTSPCKNLSQSKFIDKKIYNKCKSDYYLRKLKYLNLINKNDDDYVQFVDEKIIILSQLGKVYLNSGRSTEGIILKEKAYELSSEYENQLYDIIKKKGMWTSSALKGIQAEELGMSYLWNKKIRNYKKAIKYFKITNFSNHQNHFFYNQSKRRVNFNMALMYIENRGLKYNEKLAFKLFKKSTSNELGRTHTYIGDFYLLGLGGLKKDYFKAIKHYKLAAIGSSYLNINYENLRVLYQNNRLPNNANEFYKWIKMNLNEKNFSIYQVMRLGYFSNTMVKNYSESYQWYYACSKIKKKFIANIDLFNECEVRLDILEKKYLSTEEIRIAKKLSKENIIDKYIRN
jgi:hypothetical protein